MKRGGNILPLLELQVWLGVCIGAAVVRAAEAALINSLFLRIYPLNTSSEKKKKKENEVSVIFVRRAILLKSLGFPIRNWF